MQKSRKKIEKLISQEEAMKKSRIGCIDYSEISPAVIKRLPLYRRQLRLLGEEGTLVVSSAQLAERLDLTPVQIRKDLAYFGAFGKKGVGYVVEDLRIAIDEIVGLGRTWNVAVAGISNLGTAIFNYANFERYGFFVKAAFEERRELINHKYQGITVYSLGEIEEVVRKNKVKLGIIATSEDRVQEVADAMVRGGVEGIWLFTVTPVEVPPHVSLLVEDLVQEMCRLTYYVNNK